MSTALLLALVFIADPIQEKPTRDAAPTPEAAQMQVANRVSLRGTVRSSDNKSWVAARVMLHSRTVQGLPGVGRVDRLEVVTNERGRFTAKVLPHARYLVWAVSTDEGNIYRTTRALQGVQAGRPIRLVERKNQFVQMKFSVDPGEHWKDRAPFSIKLTNERILRNIFVIRAHTELSKFVLEHELAKSGPTVLPRLPFEEVMVEIYDKAGILLSKHSVQLAKSARQAAFAGAKSGRVAPGPAMGFPGMQVVDKDEFVALDHQRFVIPDPQKKSFKIVAKKKAGEPVPHAKVYQVVRGRYVLLAEAGEDGKVSVTLPKQSDSMYALLYGVVRAEVVCAEGFAEMPFSPHTNNPFLAIAGVPADSKQNSIVLKKQSVAKGRLLWHGKPVKGADLLLVNKGNSMMVLGQTLHYSRIVTTDAEGRFVIEQLQRGNKQHALLCVLPDAVLVSKKGEAVPHRLAVIAFASSSKDRDFGDIELSTLSRLVVNVKLPDGSPSRDADLLLVGEAGRGMPGLPGMTSFCILRSPTDRKGRVVLLLPEASGLQMLVHDETGYSYRALSAAAGYKEIDVTIEPLAYRGIIKDAQGKALSGVSVTNMTVAMANSKGPLKFAQALLGKRFQGVSDEEGRFLIWSPGDHDTLRLSLMRQTAAGTIAGPVQKSIDVSAGRGTELVLEFDAATAPKLGMNGTIIIGAPAQVAKPKKENKEKKGKDGKKEKEKKK